MAGRIFDGLRVIDCASYIAGPAAATVMSDFGAEVIKIEPPGMGDPYRAIAMRAPDAPMSPNWVMDARNKQSLAIDLSSDGGREVLRRLVATADVFITNFPPPVRRKLGLRHEDLAPLNDRLIYASFTGYGEIGPEADKPGFDVTAWWARSGLMDLVRSGPDATPARSLPGMGDHPSAMALYGAIVTGLYQREKTGRGLLVGSSLLANGLWANSCSVQQQLCGEPVVVQPARTEAPFPTRNHYCCRDGRWIILSILPTGDRWQRFSAVVGGDLNDADPHALTAQLDERMATRDFSDWAARLDAAGLIFGIVARIEDVATDDQAIAAGVLVPFENASLMTVSSPFWLAGQDKVTPRRAPEVGEHNDAVLHGAGYTPDDIAGFRAAGVIG